jgi:hypothetical protein
MNLVDRKPMMRREKTRETKSCDEIEYKVETKS